MLCCAGAVLMVCCSTFVRILNGHQCGHEGGGKCACKKHRLCTFTLLSLTGQHIMSASHLAALAQWLKVGSGRNSRSHLLSWTVLAW